MAALAFTVVRPSSAGAARVAAAAGRRPHGGSRRGQATSTRVIDVHSHFLQRVWPDFAKLYGGENWPSMRHAGELPDGTYGYGRPCAAMLMLGDSDFRPVTAPCWDVRARLEDLDAAGVDQQVISQTPLLFQWHRDAATAAAIARDFNDAAIEMTREVGAEGRLHAFCQVALQDVDLACQEVSRAKGLGHVGVQIGNHLGARDLDDDELVAFLAHCAAEDFPVLVHPWDMSRVGPGDRARDFMLGWTAGMPLETHLSISRMVLGGAFDRLPPSLRICFSHGGGAFPALLGRLDNAWRQRSAARGRALRPPRDYVGRFYVDSAVFDPHVLRLLVDTLGADRVMLGSDYPFPLGEQRIGGLARACPGLTAEQRARILGGNAAEFLRLPQGVAAQAVPEPDALVARSCRAVALLEGGCPIPEHRGAWARAELQPRRARGAGTAAPAPEAWETWFDVHFQARGPRGGAAAGARTAAEGPGLPDAPWGLGGSQSQEALATCSLVGVRQAPGASGVPRSIREAALCIAEDGPHPTSASPQQQPHMRRVMNIVGGRRQWPGSGLSLTNPATGEVEGEVAASEAQDVEAAVQSAQDALDSDWGRWPLEARCAALHRLADLVDTSSHELALAESADTGKPLALAEALDIPRSAANLRFFASLAPHAASDVKQVHGPLESMSYTLRKPVGVVGIVTPWNLPLYLLTWKLAPALAMGNTVVAKPSELTPTTATRLAELCLEAGLPRGVVSVVHGRGAVVGEALAAHPGVAAVSFTGGTETGARVAAVAAPHFKKLSLELGGKNAALVFDDCAFEETVEGVLRSSFLNSGQICLCTSRILVQRGADGRFYDRFLEAFVAAASRLVVGPPEEASTDIGPLVSAQHLEKVRAAVEHAEAAGAQVLCGGRSERGALGKGFFHEPTVIAGLSAGSAIAQNEVFGPVVTVHPFETEEEALELANGTRYGLSASLWTESLRRAELAERLCAGTVWVNTWLNRELHMPFGGLRDSGVNREGGVHSLDFFSEASTVCVKRGSRRPLGMPGRLGRRGVHTSAAAPRPLGRYALAREAGGLVFLAGIGPRDPVTDEVAGGPVTDPATGARRDYDAAAQARQCFTNVRSVLATVGCKLSDVVDVQVLLVDMKRDFNAFNEVWACEMKGIEVARTTIGVTDLPPGGRIAVELKVVAVRRA